MTKEVVTMTDARACGFCAAGVISRLVQLGFPKWQILKGGIPIEQLAEVDDAQVQRAIEVARKRIEEEKNGQGRR